MAQERKFWMSTKSLRWVALAATVLVLHVLIHLRFPLFAVPAVGKPTWITIGLGCDMIINLIILVAGISSLTRKIPLTARVVRIASSLSSGLNGFNGANWAAF